MTTIRPLDIKPAELGPLARELTGPLHSPGDPGYADHTQPRNTAGTQAPGAVAVAAGPDDVAACVRWAREHGHRVLVQATGHGFAGTVAAGTLLIDLSALNQIDIDDARARAGAGAQWGAVNAAAEPRGWLGLSGTAPDVGVAGYTFHGGVGWLTRQHGLASAHLTAVEFIDGTGTARRADEASDPDLLWAFRGGGGLGIATAVEFGLVPAGDLHAGFLLWPASAAEPVISAWASTVSALPASVTSSIGMLQFPDAPMVAGPLRGQRGVHLSMACCDGPEAARALFEALSQAAPPAQNTFGPCDAARLGTIHLDPPAAVPAVGQGLWLDQHTPGHALAILGVLGFGPDAPLAELELRHVAAPASDPPAGAMTSAPGGFALHATGGAPNPEALARVQDAHEVVAAAAEPVSAGYQAAAFCDGRTDATRSYDPAVGQRLRELATRTDPDQIITRPRQLY